MILLAIWSYSICSDTATSSVGDLQDPKMEVLYHIKPYFLGIFPSIGLKNRPYIHGTRTSNQSVPWPLTSGHMELSRFRFSPQDPVKYLPAYEEGLLGFLADTAPKAAARAFWRCFSVEKPWGKPVILDRHGEFS